MVVHDFNVQRCALIEAKTQTPLRIDSKAPKTFQVARQGFQSVRRRKTQIFYGLGRMQLGQTHHSALENFQRQATRFTGFQELAGFLASEAFDPALL